MIVRVYGSGLPTSGENLMGNTELGVLGTNGTGGKHAVSSKKIKDAFGENGILAPSGTFTLKALCVDDSGTNTYAEFEGAITFTALTATNSSYTSSIEANKGTETVLTVPATATYGDSVTLSASVASEDGSVGGVGTVQFKDGATNLGSPQAVVAGAASYTTSILGAGPHANITAVYSGGTGVGGSTSTAGSLTIAKAATTVAVTTNGPSAEFAAATFTATATSGVAGTVQFKINGSNVGAPVAVSGGVASFSKSDLTAGTYTVDATFTPTGGSAANYNGSSAAPASHVVTAYAGASTSETLTTNVTAGALTISVEGDALVAMSDATMNPAGDLLVSTGDIDPVVVTDTRAGDPGWVASGVVSNFTHGADSVNAYNLGWTPSVVSLSANQAGAFVLGDAVVAATEPAAGSVPVTATQGLGAQRVVGTAPDNSGNGTAKLGAHLTLNIPTDVPAGAYTATLTFTAI